MEKYDIKRALELVPQSAIKQCYITDSPGYNAARDYHITPDGKRFAIGVQDNLGCVYEYIL